jgi:hypothetical protein
MPANSGIALGQWSGSDATQELEATISELNEATAKRTLQLIRLTWFIAGLTLVMTVA